MKVNVVWQRSTELDLNHWRLALRATYRNADELMTFFLAFIRVTLIDSRGKPLGAVEDLAWRPTVYWWQFMEGWWIRFAAERRPSSRIARLLFGATLKITILELTTEGPS